MNKKLTSTAELQEAVRKLEAFAQTDDPASSPVSKTIQLMRSILGKNDYGHEVRKAVETVQRHRLLIQKLQQGNSAEQELAKSVSQAVTAYNKRCKELNISSQKGFAKFFTTKKVDSKKALPSINLPQTATVKRHYPAKNPTLPGKHTLSISAPLSKQSKELFHMKVLALLERYGIANNPEARALVKQTPILTTQQEGTSTYTLSQTLSLLPGQTIVVMGASTLDIKTQTISGLFPDSFSVSLESTQTGFPHPLQRHGWSLAAQLMPDTPQRPDLLDNAAAVFQAKREIMAALEPGGNLVERAKYLLKQKKQIFTSHSLELLQMHYELAVAICQAGLSDIANIKPCIDTFFNQLKRANDPFERLTDAYQTMRDLFIVRPHKELLDAILAGKDSDFTNQDPLLRFEAARRTLFHSIESTKEEIKLKLDSAGPQEQVKLGFICSMGSLIGQASLKIILQYLSEDLIFSPPVLSLFEQRLQAAAYAHAADFQRELLQGNINQEEIYASIKRLLQEDILRFQQDQFPLVNELAAYFQQRYS